MINAHVLNDSINTRFQRRTEITAVTQPTYPSCGAGRVSTQNQTQMGAESQLFLDRVATEQQQCGHYR